MVKKMIYMLLAFVLCVVVLAGCGTNTPPAKETMPPQEQKVAWEDMERVDVFLPDLEEEFKADWKAFYEKYKDVVLVVTGRVQDNRLDKISNEFAVSQGGTTLSGKKTAAQVIMLFDEVDRTDELLRLPNRENVVLEGVLKPLEENNIRHNVKPLKLVLVHSKLIEHSPWVNNFYFDYDITPAFEETKTELLSKYPFVTNIEFSVVRTGKDGDFLSSDDLRFITDVKTGTDPKLVLDYADYAVRLLNENTRKIDSTFAPSTGDSYGGLYKRHYLSVWVRPEGVVEARNKYYIFDVVSDRVGKVIQLQKAYRYGQLGTVRS